MSIRAKMGSILGRALQAIRELRQGPAGCNASRIHETALQALHSVNTLTTEFSNMTSTAPIEVFLSGVYDQMTVKSAMPPLCSVPDVITVNWWCVEYDMKIACQQQKHAHTHLMGTQPSITSINTWWTTSRA